MSTFDTSKAKASLIEERGRLVHQLDELGAAESGDLRSDIDFGDSFADAGSVTAERTEVLGLVDSIKGQLDDVDAALARIESGKYGECANCGKDIPAARLEARPASILCIDCKTASR
ncbi:MAG: TraR/DksA C4-type zinc finger protein [Acidimicrobiia bacterium]